MPYICDRRNFTQLPVRDRNAVWRMTCALWGPSPPDEFDVAGEDFLNELFAEARQYRLARGWFDFGFENPPVDGDVTDPRMSPKTEDYMQE